MAATAAPTLGVMAATTAPTLVVATTAPTLVVTLRPSTPVSPCKVARECGGEYLGGRLLPQNGFALTFQHLDTSFFVSACAYVNLSTVDACIQRCRGDSRTTVGHRVFKKSVQSSPVSQGGAFHRGGGVMSEKS